ncbi:MAG TPA: cysteine peptidase family C39 domain-containing protein, partial [Polyangiaceae bacterium]|nr:cysteine peptidase family C39 domain-containing protein [Polyangiaceae bacterium]
MNPLTRLFRSRIRPLQQMEAAECGVTCLAMILAHYGAAIPLDELRIECGTSRDGNSALQLLEAARRLGLEGRGLKLDIAELERAERPLILHWRLNHFVVLEGWRGGRARLVDPASGRVQLDREQVDQCFSGIALELEPTAALVRRKPRAFGVAQYFANLRRRLPAVAFILVAGACSQLLGLVSPAVSQVLIDEVLRAARTSWLLPLLAVLIGANFAGLV